MRIKFTWVKVITSRRRRRLGRLRLGRLGPYQRRNLPGKFQKSNNVHTQHKP